MPVLQGAPGAETGRHWGRSDRTVEAPRQASRGLDGGARPQAEAEGSWGAAGQRSPVGGVAGLRDSEWLISQRS